MIARFGCDDTLWRADHCIYDLICRCVALFGRSGGVDGERMFPSEKSCLATPEGHDASIGANAHWQQVERQRSEPEVSMESCVLASCAAALAG